MRHFLAAYDLETGRLFGQCTEQKTAVQFLAFLKWLRRRYRADETLHIVLDNCGTHLTEEVQSWAHAHRVKFYLTPTNASWLNRIESQFTALKKFALENSDFRSHDEQQEAIESDLELPRLAKRSPRDRHRILALPHTQESQTTSVARDGTIGAKLMNWKRH